MGDYNISCFVSGLSIGSDDRYYIIPLLKNKEYNARNTPYGQYDLFRPATMPMLAIYDNCGHCDVIQNNHTRFLEKRFKMSINEIADYCNRKLFDNYCFVHESVFDALLTYYDYAVKKTQMYDYERELDKYNTIYRRNIHDTVQHLKTFKKIHKKTPDEDTKEYITDQIKKIKEWDYYIHSSNIITLAFEHMPEVEALYRVRLMNGFFKDDLISFLKFSIHLYSISKPYMPTPLGEQYGNYGLANAVLNATKKITCSKIKRIKDSMRD